MAVEIVTPELGTQKKSTKDLVISVLMYDHPINLTKITNSIKKKFNVSVTFQGVRKAVNQLVENGVLSKQKKEYAVSKTWILRLREFVESLQESYFSGSKGIRHIQSIGEDIKVYTFDNLVDLDQFWNSLIAKWFDESANGSDEFYVQQSGHTWYVLGNLEEEAGVLDKIKKYNIQFYTLVTGDSILDGWCKRYYEEQGFFYAKSGRKKKEDTSRYFSVYKDKVIQCTYPEDLARQIDEIYEKARNFESFDVTKLIRLLRRKEDLKITVMRNPVVAEQLKKSILAHFK